MKKNLKKLRLSRETLALLDGQVVSVRGDAVAVDLSLRLSDWLFR
jgi:hypothetical protein